MSFNWAIPDGAHSSICCENDNGSDGGFQGSLKVSETLQVEHVNFIDE